MERICYPMSLAPGGDVRPESQYISVGHSYKKGLSETIAYSHLIGAGMDMLRDDVSVTIDGTRYEPDLVYMNESRGIYIDIEVDEPYSAKGKPTHYCREDGVPKDERRNMSFRAHGWHVLRFTEEQLFRFPEGCARMIAQLLVSLGEMDAIPQGLLHSAELEPVPQWTYEESRQICAARFRNSYIGFTPGNHDLLKDHDAIMSIGKSMLTDVLRNPKALKAVLTPGNIKNLFKGCRS